MRGGEVQFELRPAELRLAFDQSFAAAPQAELLEFEDLLAIGVDGDHYAIRLSEISGLFVDKTVARLPSPLSQLRGIAALRGALVPVYDLRALLGYSAGESPRWLVVAARTPVGLAFDAFDSHLRMPSTAIAAAESAEHSRQHIREVLRSEERAWPIVSMASLIEAIARLARRAGAKQEK